MHPSKYRPALNAYCALLEEAKHRLVALDLLLSGKTGLAAGAVHESAYLQLRMLCETIALGCVIAKGDHEPTGKIRTEYRAGKIIEYMDRIHPEFYPRAAKQTQAGPEVYDAILVDDGYLTKEDLKKLHSECGMHLHRGTIKRLASKPQYDREHKVIRMWKEKIETLLRYHIISMLDKRTVVLFVLSNKQNNDKVQCVVVESDALLNMLSG
jgi:hypothetical protein